MRPGPWGNPYKIGVHGDRDQVCDKFEAGLKHEYELLSERHRLRGRILLCCCDIGQRCHVDTWVRVAEFTPDQLMDWMLGFPPLDDL